MQINKCSVFQEPLGERKGDSKGKEFPLDYLENLWRVLDVFSLRKKTERD